MGGGADFKLENLKPIIKDIHIDDAYTLFTGKRLLVLNSVNEEPHSDSIVSIYCISRTDNDHKGLDIWQSAMLKDNAGIPIYQVDFLKKTYKSSLKGDAPKRNNPLTRLSKQNTLTINEIKTSYLNRSLFISTGALFDGPTGNNEIPLISDIKLEDAKSIFENYNLLVRYKVKTKPADDDVVDVFLVGSKSVNVSANFAYKSKRKTEYFYAIPADKVIDYEKQNKTSNKPAKSAKDSLREQLKK